MLLRSVIIKGKTLIFLQFLVITFLGLTFYNFVKDLAPAQNPAQTFCAPSIASSGAAAMIKRKQAFIPQLDGGNSDISDSHINDFKLSSPSLSSPSIPLSLLASSLSTPLTSLCSLPSPVPPTPSPSTSPTPPLPYSSPQSSSASYAAIPSAVFNTAIL